MRYSISAQNSYYKPKVIAACEATLKSIEAAREDRKAEIFTGKREYWLFGRLLTIEEAYQKGSPGSRLKVICWYGLQEMEVQQILTAAKLCKGDFINLTRDELSYISGYWE